MSRRVGRAALVSSARSTIRAQSSAKGIPAASAIFGKRLIGVKPGIVLISLR